MDDRALARATGGPRASSAPATESPWRGPIVLPTEPRPLDRPAAPLRSPAWTTLTPRLDPLAPRVLVVDDDPAILEVLGEFVSDDLGLVAVQANNGAVALEAVAAARPDLVLLDLRMPILDGFEACRRLKADPTTRAIPVVAVSADGNRRAALACGCDDFVAKPFDLDAIERVVRRWLG